MGRYVPSSSTVPSASQVPNTPAGGILATDVQSAINELDTDKLEKSGGSLTGFLNLHADPTSNTHAATKKYVDDTNGKIPALASPPTSPSNGELYFDTSLLALQVYDGTSWNGVGSGGSNGLIPALASPPSSPATGQAYFDTGTNELLIWDGATWRSTTDQTLIPPLAVAPSSPVTGQAYLDTGTNQINIWDGATWIPVGGGGGGATVASGIVFTPVGNIAATNVQSAIQEVDTEKLDKSGGTMTGAITLSGAPTSGLHATTKTYVDDADTYVGTSAPTGTALYEGKLWYDTVNDVVKSYNGTTWNTVNGGGGSTVASGITVTPVGNVSATNVQSAIQELDSEKLDKSGGTMTGALTLNGAPTSGLQATTKTYVDDADTYVGAAAPTGTALYEGKLWYDTVNDVVKMYNGTVWNTVGGGGSGDVVGPASSTDRTLPVFSGTTGKLLADTTVVIDATNKMGIGQATPLTTLDLSGNFSQNIVAVAALAIDCSLGNYFTKTIAANSTFTITNVPATRCFSFTLELGHTSGTVTWPASVAWPGSTASTLVTGKTHLFMFVTDDGGTRWRGSYLANYTT